MKYFIPILCWETETQDQTFHMWQSRDVYPGLSDVEKFSFHMTPPDKQQKSLFPHSSTGHLHG